MEFFDDDEPVRDADEVTNLRLIENENIDISSMIANLMGTAGLTFDEAKKSVLMTLEEKKKELRKLKEDQLIQESNMTAIYDAETRRIATKKVAEDKSKKVSAFVTKKTNELQKVVQRLATTRNTELLNHLQQFINSEDEYMKLSNPKTLKLFENQNKMLKKEEIEALSNYFEDDRLQEYKYDSDEDEYEYSGGKRLRTKSIKRRKSKRRSRKSRKSKRRTIPKKN